MLETELEETWGTWSAGTVHGDAMFAVGSYDVMGSLSDEGWGAVQSGRWGRLPLPA